MKRITSFLLIIVLLLSLAVPVAADVYTTGYAVEDEGNTFWICLGIGAVLALIVVGVMAAQLKSVKPKNSAGSYIRRGSLNVTLSRDIFLYQNTIRREKPKNKS